MAKRKKPYARPSPTKPSTPKLKRVPIRSHAELTHIDPRGQARMVDVSAKNATERLAGIMAAKRTHGLIPLCHPLPITKVEIDINPEHSLPGFLVQATVKVTAQTGVEMEALTAVSIACLTIYDMVKAVERGMRIEGIRLLRKSGGKSGDYRVEDFTG